MYIVLSVKSVLILAAIMYRLIILASSEKENVREKNRLLTLCFGIHLPIFLH